MSWILPTSDAMVVGGYRARVRRCVFARALMRRGGRPRTAGRERGREGQGQQPHAHTGRAPRARGKNDATHHRRLCECEAWPPSRRPPSTSQHGQAEVVLTAADAAPRGGGIVVRWRRRFLRRLRFVVPPRPARVGRHHPGSTHCTCAAASIQAGLPLCWKQPASRLGGRGQTRAGSTAGAGWGHMARPRSRLNSSASCSS